jgi:hypothetical protein
MTHHSVQLPPQPGVRPDVIDSVHPYISWYLWAFSGVFAVCFVGPLLVAPLVWARAFRWALPAETALTVYFGRCLGAAGIGIVAGAVRAAPHPGAHAEIFEIVIVAATLLCLVHVVGAFEKRQPWTATAEIPLYAAIAIANVLMYRAL